MFLISYSSLRVFSKDPLSFLLTSHNLWKIVSFFIIYLTTLCLSCIFLFFPLNVLFLVTAIADWESQCIDIDGVDFIPQGMLVKKFFNHSTSLPSISRVANSDSIVDLAKIVCLVDLQAITTTKSKYITTSGFCLIWIRDPVSIAIPFNYWRKSTVFNTIIHGTSQISHESNKYIPMILIRIIGISTQSAYCICNIRSRKVHQVQ